MCMVVTCALERCHRNAGQAVGNLYPEDCWATSGLLPAAIDVCRGDGLAHGDVLAHVVRCACYARCHILERA